jgi:hypothetical protein
MLRGGIKKNNNNLKKDIKKLSQPVLGFQTRDLF